MMYMDLAINQFLGKSLFVGFSKILSMDLAINSKNLIISLILNSLFYLVSPLKQNIIKKKQVYKVYKNITNYYIYKNYKKTTYLKQAIFQMFCVDYILNLLYKFFIKYSF